MYHTFQASTAVVSAEEPVLGKTGRPGGPRRISTSNACVECRRRKIRCDGLKPCGQCQWYQHPEQCAYSKPTQRVVPSRKLVDKLQSHLDQCNAILSRLYPGKDLETLMSLPREELINLAVTLPAPASSPSSNSTSDSLPHIPETTQKSEGADSLEALEQAPDQDPEIDEEKRHKVKVQGISDDINGLSLTIDKQSSYVGVSSVNAALKVIFKTAPVARPFIAQTYTETALPSRCNSPPPQFRDADPDYTPPPDVGHKLIESYFAHVHVLMPMIDEDQFWHVWLYGERKDPPWLALLNMVLALGSLAMSTADNEDHIAYFQRARRHMDLETFGSGNLLILQALGLLSGYYLHWLNRPNEANCLMGATLRMATALGLHREYSDGQPTSVSNARGSDGAEVPAEIRRRTWWSLFCLDAWGSTTTGRPSLGRVGPGITVQSPKVPQQLNNAQYLASLKLLPIIHNITFCKLATRVQDTLAERPLLNYDELFSLDAELVRWHDDLPPILRPVGERRASLQKQRSNSLHNPGRPSIVTPSSASSTLKNPFDFSQPPERDNTSCPDFLKTPRAIMHWRYQNLRMLMHRPFLLATTLRKTPFANLTAEEKVAVARCRIIAGQTIADIDSTCEEDLIAGWNAVWLMFQAVMVPLVSLFARLSSVNMPVYAHSSSPPKSVNGDSEPSPCATTGGDDEEEQWRLQIETAMAFFDRMQRYSVAAKKSNDVVHRLYEASKHVSDWTARFQRPQVQQMYASMGLSPGQVIPSDIHQHGSTAAAAADIFADHPALHPGNLQMPPPPTHPAGPIGPGVWGLSPNGDAALNVFWDDMMWDTLPSDAAPQLPPPPQNPQDFNGIGPGITDFDWSLVTSNGGEVCANGQPWQYWQSPGGTQV